MRICSLILALILRLDAKRDNAEVISKYVVPEFAGVENTTNPKRDGGKGKRGRR